MKIGIFTLQLHTNYGGILQAYALQKVLKKLGHDVWLIERKDKFRLPFRKLLPTYARRIIRKYLLRRKDAIVFLERKKRREFSIISVNTGKFIKENIAPTLLINKMKDIPSDFFDAIVVGSDQIWRPRYSKPRIESAFLDFAKNWKSLKRISYAASFGTSEWEYNKKQTQKCRSLVKMFNAVSVREDTGVGLCEKYLDTKAELVLDPTMLLDVSIYIQLIERSSKKIDGGLFVYVLDIDEEKNELIKLIKNNLGIKPFYTSTDSQKADVNNRIATPVEEWLKSFYYADCIVTDSFHACVFSILFNKPFFVCGNKDRGLARIQSLLKLFELEDRLILDNLDFINQRIEAKIDWGKTNQILTELREESYKFLSNSLKV